MLACVSAYNTETQEWDPGATEAVEACEAQAPLGPCTVLGELTEEVTGQPLPHYLIN